MGENVVVVFTVEVPVGRLRDEAQLERVVENVVEWAGVPSEREFLHKIYYTEIFGGTGTRVCLLGSKRWPNVEKWAHQRVIAPSTRPNLGFPIKLKASG